MNRMVYFFEKAFRSIRQGLWVNLIALGTIAIAMLIFLSYLLVIANLQNNIDRWRSQMKITVYLSDEIAADPPRRGELKQSLEALVGAERVRYIDKDHALNLYREDLGGYAGILDDLEENPLPAYFEVEPPEAQRTPDGVRGLATRILQEPNAADVAYGEDWLGRLEAVLSLLNLGGLILGGLLFCAVMFVISNTIRLTLYARRDEIEIMQLVGATRSFIAIPFFIEGAVQALASALLALLVLWLAYALLIAGMVTEAMVEAFGSFETVFLSGSMILWILLGSLLLGMLGSYLALQRFLNARL